MSFQKRARNASSAGFNPYSSEDSRKVKSRSSTYSKLAEQCQSKNEVLVDQIVERARKRALAKNRAILAGEKSRMKSSGAESVTLEQFIGLKTRYTFLDSEREENSRRKREMRGEGVVLQQPVKSVVMKRKNCKGGLRVIHSSERV